jgi:hypothetical protein
MRMRHSSRIGETDNFTNFTQTAASKIHADHAIAINGGGQSRRDPVLKGAFSNDVY